MEQSEVIERIKELAAEVLPESGYNCFYNTSPEELMNDF